MVIVLHVLSAVCLGYGFVLARRESQIKRHPLQREEIWRARLSVVIAGALGLAFFAATFFWPFSFAG